VRGELRCEGEQVPSEMLEGKSPAAGGSAKWCALTVCLFAAGLVRASSPLPSLRFPAQQNSSGALITAQVSLVLLPVTVTDREGHFVTGLDVSDFRVFEDGHPQQIKLFRHEDTPVTVGILVDRSGSMAARSGDVLAGAQAFVQASNLQDREFVINFSDKVEFGLPVNVAFTNNVDELKAALSLVPPSGRTALFDALAAGLTHFQKDDPDKKVLLLISDGGDNASEHKFAEVLRMAQSSNVIIYTIGLLDVHSADQNPSILKKLARETGGHAYFPNSAEEILKVCREIAEEIRHQYTLGYDPPENGRQGYRKIRVAVTAHGRGKQFVRTRGGYFFPAAAAPQPEGLHGEGR
jgi:Ca-activated chloride channel family protein